jgi:hypothetical protein
VLQKAVLQEGHFHVVTAGAQAHENFLSHLHLNAHYKEKLPNQFHLKTSASDACSKTIMYQTGSNICIIQYTKLAKLTTSVGFAAPHLRILQVLRNAKLVLPHFGHNQSPSDTPSGPRLRFLEPFSSPKFAGARGAGIGGPKLLFMFIPYPSNNGAP